MSDAQSDFVTIPADLPRDAEALDELEKQIRQRYARLREEAGSDPSDEQIAEMEDLAEALDRIEAARRDLDKADERAARAAAVAERFATTDEETEGGEAESPAETETEAAAGESETPDPESGESGEAGAGEAGADDSNADAAGGAEADEDDPEEAEADPAKADDTDDTDDPAEGEKEHNMSKTKFGGAAGGEAAPRSTEPDGIFTLDRAVPSYTPGPVGILDAAKAFEEVASGRALVSTGDARTVSAQFAHIDRRIPEDLIVADERAAGDVIDRAADETRLDGGSLTAAAGWCAPSTTVYDFLATDPAGDLFSLPEISVARGGIRFPVEPDMSNLYELDNFLWTEADAIAGTKTKTCVEIPCPEMEEVRLDAIWTCITSNLLANKGWPEMTAKFVREAARAHLHRISAYRLRKVVEGSDEVTFTTGAFADAHYGAAGAILSALALQAEDIRAKHRLPQSRSIEVILPRWTKEALRADLALRDSVLPQDVTDAMLAQWFSTRGLSVQYVSDWQNDVVGGATAATAYPDALKAVMYPAGTWWSAVEPVINLGVTYDSTGLSKNQRTEMFVEDGVGVGKRGYESRLVTVPLLVTGGVGYRVSPPATA